MQLNGTSRRPSIAPIIYSSCWVKLKNWWIAEFCISPPHKSHQVCLHQTTLINCKQNTRTKPPNTRDEYNPIHTSIINTFVPGIEPKIKTTIKIHLTIRGDPLTIPYKCSKFLEQYLLVIISTRMNCRLDNQQCVVNASVIKSENRLASINKNIQKMCISTTVSSATIFFKIDLDINLKKRREQPINTNADANPIDVATTIEVQKTPQPQKGKFN
eukprot:TRINITY_DN3586_c0_g1_i3.p5 TRINITY_DN3586_c0_g1~~TRINITY_DN3586_c0_g1_i3.p5  ORF type:complete len:215 (-),score=-8.96 TRINITY_DN3586_c0_g1_i3:3604-4248(-)